MTTNLDIDYTPPKTTLARTMRRRAATIAIFLALIWLVWLVNLPLGGRLNNFGIVPRTLTSLPGILLAPFLHANASHAFNNSLGILLLGGFLILRNEKAFWTTTLLGTLATGVGTWVIGRGNSVHIGASGIIFAYFGYLLSAGIFEKKISSILISLVVFFFWGGMLWAVLPGFNPTQISWEGHLCGFAGGILTAWLLAKRARPIDPHPSPPSITL